MSQTYSKEERTSRIKGIVGAASGNLVEWFDFYIYAVFAAYFTHALTAPDMEPTTKAIYVWGGCLQRVSLCVQLEAGCLDELLIGMVVKNRW
jgi:MHS family dicarboxylic acid transporter PcaT-like MFS transporter